ncbi:MAG: hypothetical protein IKQ91_09460 [Oscillospiraceae bacterium]|nr:hypothetical protein [Oscillospiraceae bacterium]
MVKKRIIALCLSVLTLLPLCSCEYFDFTDASSAEDASAQDSAVNELKAEIEQLQDDWTYQGNEAEIQTVIDNLLLAVDVAYAKMERANAEYYADWSNAELKQAYQQADSDYQIIYHMVTWAIVNGYRKSMYASVFEPYYTDDGSDNYYIMNTLNRVMKYARRDAAEYDSMLNDYYDTAYSDEIDADETNLKCAKLYLDTLKTYDTSHYLYDIYGRDYTAEEISALYPLILERIVPMKEAVAEKLEVLKDTYYDTYDQDAAELLKTYAPKLCPEIAESSEKLFSESLYIAPKGDNCYDGGFTVAFPNEQSGLIYLYMDDTIYDLINFTHEFGHFHSEWRETTPIYLRSNEKDIAEVQSQGMEMLFLSFYPEILEDASDYYELIALYNILDSVVSGFMVGEFEYQVMQKSDQMDAEDVVALFEQMRSEATFEPDLYQITHLYEQPGYYISYGISALPALQIYTIMKENLDSAVQIYEKISELPSSSGDISYISAMEECGLPSFLETESVDQLADDLQKCLNQFDT